MFYIPECEEKPVLQGLIEKHGGMVSMLHECFTYQLHPLLELVPQKHFFRGDVYKATWITDSIKAGQLLDKDDYFLRNYNELDTRKNRSFDIGGKHPYTITEALKIN